MCLLSKPSKAADKKASAAPRISDTGFSPHHETVEKQEQQQQEGGTLPQLQLELKDGKDWTESLRIAAMAATSKLVATIQEDQHVVLLYRSEQFDHALHVSHKPSVRYNAIIDLGGQEFPNCVAISPDSQHCVVSLDFNNRLRMFKYVKNLLQLFLLLLTFCLN